MMSRAACSRSSYGKGECASGNARSKSSIGGKTYHSPEASVLGEFAFVPAAAADANVEGAMSESVCSVEVQGAEWSGE